MLCCIVLCRGVFYSVVSCSVVLYCVMCSVMLYIVVPCKVMLYSAEVDGEAGVRKLWWFLKPALCKLVRVQKVHNTLLRVQQVQSKL